MLSALCEIDFDDITLTNQSRMKDMMGVLVRCVLFIMCRSRN